jgi:hypothetical protein
MPGQNVKELIVCVRYQDHVLYNRGDPALMRPQVREAVGWLVYECADYIIMAWDRDAGPPTLRGGDPKASGLVVLRTEILELKRVG